MLRVDASERLYLYICAEGGGGNGDIEDQALFSRILISPAEQPRVPRAQKRLFLLNKNVMPLE